MSLADCKINTPNPDWVNHLFFDPPDPPTLPAVRQRYHNGRKWKLEPQGRADRRARRHHRAMMTWWHSDQRATASEMVMYTELKSAIASSESKSLYDFLMGK